jgi:hypothetical protein
MRRLFGLLLFAGVGAVAAGCSPEGSYRLSWAFRPAGGPEEPAQMGCGAHGVDAIRIVATGAEGQQTAIVPCTDGVTTRKILAATWGFSVHALGPDGAFKEPLPAEGTNILHANLGERAIGADSLVDLDTVFLEPQPACRDGVDNDRDGRVDTDDPQCADGQGPSETALAHTP